ncbi:MAG TPA: transglycosylase domain-containing protein, partial [Pseudonocardiaceae bacterium]
MNDHRDDQPRDSQPSWPTGGDPDAGSRRPGGNTPGTPPGGVPSAPRVGPGTPPGRPVARGGPRQGGPGRPPGFTQRPGGPVRPGGPGVNQGLPPERATDHMPPVPDPAKANYRREPDLLTHRDDDYLQDSAANDYGDERGGLTPEELKLRKRRKAWRWVRRVMYVLIFLGVTGPIAAFYVIYQNVTVPDPQTVAFGQAQPVTIFYADGSVMTKLTTNARIFIKPDAIPINVRHAVEAAEDETFETNNGFDLKAIARTAMNQLTGGTGGGSTITQEYIKVSTGNSQHSLTRKVNEAVQAYKMTKTYTNKNDILAA